MTDLADRLTTRRHALVSALIDRNPMLSTLIAQHHYGTLERLMIEDRAAGTYHLSPRANAFLAKVPAESRGDYIRGFILALGGSLRRRFARTGLPDEFLNRYRACFMRMYGEMEQGVFIADPASNICVKDLALATLSLVPCAAVMHLPGVGIGRKLLLRAGTAAWAKVFAAGGRAGWLEQHVHAPTLADTFNARGFEESYALAAQILRADPSLRGIFGTSWFYDPDAIRLSPRLAFLRDSPSAQGGLFFRVGADAESSALAVATSPTRRAAVEAGTYRPCRYGLIWPRADVLKHYG
ncbi:MAG: hypothetical protein NVS3B27_23400 [Novosphingobium sp.]